MFRLPTDHFIVTVLFFSTDLHSAAVESESDVAGSYKTQLNIFNASAPRLKCVMHETSVGQFKSRGVLLTKQ